MGDMKSHNMVALEQVGDMKRVSGVAWAEMKETYGAHEESRDLPADQLCLETVREYCR